MCRSGGEAVKIAIIGSGISGNVVAYKLRENHDITVYEAASYVGGHSNTVNVADGEDTVAVDTGFIVFNDRTYPKFMQLLDELGQRSQDSEMSFSVQAGSGKLEYNGASLNALFAQRRNLLRPRFYRMIRDILRFNEELLYGLEEVDARQTLGDYLLSNRYSAEFAEHYLVPMAAAIWSAEPAAVMQMPVMFLVKFFDNHGLLSLRDRPTWRVIEGGSREYVSKLVAAHRDRIRLNSPVRSIRRVGRHVEVATATAGYELFDYVFIACHSDQALAMLREPTAAEESVLGAIRYQSNEAILHTDVSLLPKRRRVWAAWNYHVPENGSQRASLTYNMNILQALAVQKQYCVSLNSEQRIDPEKIIKRINYAHPIYSLEAVAAQQRQAELNSDRTFFCGAYWRNGFHEDGVVSALNALQHFEKRLIDGQLHLRRAG